MELPASLAITFKLQPTLFSRTRLGSGPIVQSATRRNGSLCQLQSPGLGLHPAPHSVLGVDLENFSCCPGAISCKCDFEMRLAHFEYLLCRQDEVFHVGQAQVYCAGNFSHWDPKITTPPGLYVCVRMYYM